MQGREKREKGTYTNINDALERNGCGANAVGMRDALCQLGGMGGGGPGLGFNFSMLEEMTLECRSYLSNIIIMMVVWKQVKECDMVCTPTLTTPLNSQIPQHTSALTTYIRKTSFFLKIAYFPLFSLEMLENVFQAKSRSSSCSRVGLKNILKALDFT